MDWKSKRSGQKPRTVRNKGISRRKRRHDRKHKKGAFSNNFKVRNRKRF